MKQQHDMTGIFLAAVTGASLLAAMLVRAFLPRMILPRLDGITLVGLSLAALVLNHYIAHGGRHDFRLVPLYAALIFGLFPWAACFLTLQEAAQLAVQGAVIFTLSTLLFDTMTDRLSSGPAAKAAPLMSALGLYLAAQCLMGIL